MRRFLTIPLLTFFLSGCQSAAFLIANMGNDPDVYVLEKDIAFGPGAHQKLDLYRVTTAVQAKGTLVFFYGGSWTSGSKDDYGFVASRFAKAGYNVVIPDYVKYPERRYPAFVEDAALATAWLSQQAGLVSGPVHLMGHSAGAHIGAMLVSDERYLKAVGLTSSFYQSFVGLAGPYDFVPKAERYKKIFGPPSRYPLMQASTFIDGSEPAMLLLYGAKDTLVAPSNVEKLSRAITQKGGAVEVKQYDGLGHMTLVGALSESVPIKSTVAEDALAFMTKS
jgi:acetyl esterase/lipase